MSSYAFLSLRVDYVSKYIDHIESVYYSRVIEAVRNIPNTKTNGKKH